MRSIAHWCLLIGLAVAGFPIGRAGAQITVPMAPSPQAMETAEAPDRLESLLQSGTLRVGMTGDYKPFSFRDPASGQFSGLDVDIAQALAASMGVKLDIVPTSWPRLMADLQAGRFDIAMGGITINLERLKHAYFSIPVMTAGKTPIARCADKDRFQTLAQIDQPSVTVITNPGGTNEAFDRANLHAAKIVVFPDNATIFDQLADGHADVMITDGVETRLQQKLHPQLCAIHPDQPFSTSELGYMMARDMPLKLYVDEFIREQDRSGAHARLIAKWLD